VTVEDIDVVLRRPAPKPCRRVRLLASARYVFPLPGFDSWGLSGSVIRLGVMISAAPREQMRSPTHARYAPPSAGPIPDPFHAEVATRSLAATEPDITSSEGNLALTLVALVFRLLPKLDLVGSSPIARSLEVVKAQAVRVAGIRTGPGDFFLGSVPGLVGALIFAAKRAFCSGVSGATRSSRSTKGGSRPDVASEECGGEAKHHVPARLLREDFVD